MRNLHVHRWIFELKWTPLFLASRNSLRKLYKNLFYTAPELAHQFWGSLFGGFERGENNWMMISVNVFFINSVQRITKAGIQVWYSSNCTVLFPCWIVLKWAQKCVFCFLGQTHLLLFWVFSLPGCEYIWCMYTFLCTLYVCKLCIHIQTFYYVGLRVQWSGLMLFCMQFPYHVGICLSGIISLFVGGIFSSFFSNVAGLPHC